MQLLYLLTVLLLFQPLAVGGKALIVEHKNGQPPYGDFANEPVKTTDESKHAGLVIAGLPDPVPTTTTPFLKPNLFDLIEPVLPDPTTTRAEEIVIPTNEPPRPKTTRKKLSSRPTRHPVTAPTTTDDSRDSFLAGHYKRTKAKITGWFRYVFSVMCGFFALILVLFGIWVWSRKVARDLWKQKTGQDTSDIELGGGDEKEGEGEGEDQEEGEEDGEEEGKEEGDVKNVEKSADAPPVENAQGAGTAAAPGKDGKSPIPSVGEALKSTNKEKDDKSEKSSDDSEDEEDDEDEDGGKKKGKDKKNKEGKDKEKDTKKKDDKKTKKDSKENSKKKPDKKKDSKTTKKKTTKKTTKKGGKKGSTNKKAKKSATKGKPNGTAKASVKRAKTPTRAAPKKR